MSEKDIEADYHSGFFEDEEGTQARKNIEYIEALCDRIEW